MSHSVSYVSYVSSTIIDNTNKLVNNAFRMFSEQSNLFVFLTAGFRYPLICVMSKMSKKLSTSQSCSVYVTRFCLYSLDAVWFVCLFVCL